MNVKAGKPVDIFVLYTNTPPPDGDDENGEGRLSQPALMRGVVRGVISMMVVATNLVDQRLGGCEKIDEEDAIAEAVSLALQADAVILVGGLSPEWESEGFDRPSLRLPGRQDELFTRVAHANPNTIVCIQAVSMLIIVWMFLTRAFAGNHLQ